MLNLVQDVCKVASEQGVIFMGQLAQFNPRTVGGFPATISKPQLWLRVVPIDFGFELQVDGKTFQVKEALKKEGFRWNAPVWAKQFRAREQNQDALTEALFETIETALYLKMSLQQN